MKEIKQFLKELKNSEKENSEKIEKKEIDNILQKFKIDNKLQKKIFNKKKFENEKIFLNDNLIFGKNENGIFIDLIDFENQKVSKFFIKGKKKLNKFNNRFNKNNLINGLDE